jgi:hypothetical protein
MTRDIHVVPLNDLREHVETRACWCGPRVESEGDTTTVVHHAADGREFDRDARPAMTGEAGMSKPRGEEG